MLIYSVLKRCPNYGRLNDILRLVDIFCIGVAFHFILIAGNFSGFKATSNAVVIINVCFRDCSETVIRLRD